MESSIETTSKGLKKHESSIEENHLELETKRSDKLKTMREQAESLRKLESDILETGLKASTIKAQNGKFVQAIGIFEKDYSQLDCEKIEVLRTKEDIEIEYDKITGENSI